MVDLLEETFIQGEYHGHVVMASYGKALEVTHARLCLGSHDRSNYHNFE